MYKILKPMRLIEGAYTGAMGDRSLSVNLLTERLKPSWRTVIYRPNQMAVPLLEGSKLFVFDSIAHARSFSRSFPGYNLTVGDFELWEVECEEPVQAFQISSGLSNVDLEIFWEHLADSYNLSRAPVGSYLVDWLIPIRRVEL